MAHALMRSGVTAIAYETVTNARGGLPLLAPMSEVAGRMAIQAGAHCLEMEQGGRVVILRLKRVRNPDAVCMSNLERFNDRMHEANVAVLLCGVRPDLMKVINSSGLISRLGSDHVFVFEETGKFWTSTLDAVRFAYETIGNDFCDTCPRRITSQESKEDWYYLI